MLVNKDRYEKGILGMVNLINSVYDIYVYMTENGEWLKWLTIKAIALERRNMVQNVN